MALNQTTTSAEARFLDALSEEILKAQGNIRGEKIVAALYSYAIAYGLEVGFTLDLQQLLHARLVREFGERNDVAH
jgi:hypothetical protein